MNQAPTTCTTRSIWLRGLLMILLAVIYQLCGTLLCFIAVIQFIIAAASDGPNLRLAAFGHALGRYIGQLVDFHSFASEDLPFPFSDWPSAQ